MQAHTYTVLSCSLCRPHLMLIPLFARWALQPDAKTLHDRLFSSLGCLVKVLHKVGHICRAQCLRKLCCTTHTCTICRLLSTCS